MLSLRAAFWRLSIFLENSLLGVRVFSFFCTYISERLFEPRVQTKRRKETGDMYDTARRVVLVKKRAREIRRRRQRREVGSLSAVCMLLLAVLMRTADTVVGPGMAAAQGSFGAMLLRQDAGGYVLVGVVAFAAAVLLTAACMRLHERDKRKENITEKKEENAP